MATANAEMRAQFVANAIAAKQEATQYGQGYAAEDVHAYLRARLQGKPAPKPEAKSWRA